MYDPALRCLDWTVVLRINMDISACAISLSDRPQPVMWVTSVRCAAKINLGLAGPALQIQKDQIQSGAFSDTLNFHGMCKCEEAEIHTPAHKRQIFSLEVPKWRQLPVHVVHHPIHSSMLFPNNHISSVRRTPHTEAHMEMAGGALA
jgi:hypothetical protein